MIKKYFNFKLFGLLESILIVDNNFRDIIKILSKGGDKVSKSLVMLFDEDIKTNINYLKASDKNDELKFVNDTQIKRIKDSGENPFDKTSNVIKVGRGIRQLFNANNLPVTDQDIESFVNLYKNAWDKKFTKMDGFRLVSGIDIRYWYLEDNYVNGGGQLNNSCMRYERCQPYLDIYVKNPEVCQLLIYVDSRNKLLGRAIVWKLTDKTRKFDYMLDRVYTRFDSDTTKIFDWFEEHFNVRELDYHAFGKNTSGCSVTIKNKDFDTYPYADSLWVLDYNDNKLLTYEGRKLDRLQIHLQQTEGYAVAPGYKRSKKLNLWIKQEDAILIKSINDYLPKSECGLDRKGGYVAKFESTYSNYYDAYVLNDLCIDTKEWGIVDKTDIITVYDNIDNNNNPIDSRLLLRSSDESTNYKLLSTDDSQIYLNKIHVAYHIDKGNFVLKKSTGVKLFVVSQSEMKNSITTKFSFRDDKSCSIFGENFKLNNYDYFIPYGVYTENVYTRNTSYFFTKNSMDLFNLDTTGREFYLCANVYRFYNFSIRGALLQHIESMNIPIDLKQSIVDEIISADKYLIENGFNIYLNNQKLYDILVLKNTSILEYINEVLLDYFTKYEVVKHFDVISSMYAKYIYNHTSSFDTFDYINSEGRRIDIRFKKLAYDDVKKILDDFIQSNIHEIYLFAYYLIIYGGKSPANSILGYCLPKLNKNTPSAKNIIDIVFYAEISGDFFRAINDIRVSFRRDYAFALDTFLKYNSISSYSDGFNPKQLTVFDDFYQKLFKTS